MTYLVILCASEMQAVSGSFQDSQQRSLSARRATRTGARSRRGQCHKVWYVHDIAGHSRDASCHWCRQASHFKQPTGRPGHWLMVTMLCFALFFLMGNRKTYRAWKRRPQASCGPNNLQFKGLDPLTKESKPLNCR